MGRRRRSKVQRIINLIRNFLAFLISHVGLCALVIGYAILGAVVFRAIELPQELRIQQMVREARWRGITNMWKPTYDMGLNTYPENWTALVLHEAYVFKYVLLKTVKIGYDGKDTEDNAQWTMSGAFLYSLTVITTIGYGHIAPRTYFGKAMTIIYAIIGIPLMLLFLTNVGDILAKIFRFLYARALKFKAQSTVCNKAKHTRSNTLRRQNSMLSARSHHSGKKSLHSGNSQTPTVQQSNHNPPKSSVFGGGGTEFGTLNSEREHPNIMGGMTSSHSAEELTYRDRFKNGGNDGEHGDTGKNDDEKKHGARHPFHGSIDGTVEIIAMDDVRNTADNFHGMMGGGGQRYGMNNVEEQSIRESTLGGGVQRYEHVTVPISVILLVMAIYLVSGAAVFCIWEKWELLNGIYFCYISLTTIGFGDLVPGNSMKGDDANAQQKLVICSLYLLFGMALIAMCFNLAQEEVVNKATRMAIKLGMIKQEEDEEDF